ncbi:MAG TPA: hypothetical protein VGS61_00655, partial [Acidimicrobiales bacterium]|nr:hypothetical protein [Acidimicrobiales bacterium]
ARDLIDTERARVTALLAELERSSQDDRSSGNDAATIDDRTASLTAEEVDDALATGLRERLEALDRAERRVDEGTYGRSVRSGRVIPDERLEADPAAELTVDEADA